MVQLKMKQEGNKKETKRLKINKGLDITRRKQEKLLLFEGTSHSKNGLYVSYFTLG